MYFKNIPLVNYLVKPAESQSQPIYAVLTDITRNVRFKKEIIDNIVMYDYYILKDGETMEMVSEKFYGTPQYHWVLMLLNDIYDYRSDMPLNTAQFEQYIISKYGSVATAKTTLAFYRSESGLAVDQVYTDELGATKSGIPVYAYETEVLYNEAKRKIKVITRTLMSTVIKNYEDLMK